MEDLLLEYKQTKEMTIEKINLLKAKIEELEEKLPTKSEEKNAEIKGEISKLKAEKTLYSSCKSDLNYAIFWMEHGHAPGNTRGIERRAIYEREKSFDPLIMQRYFRSKQPEYPWDTRPSYESIVDADEKEAIDFALQNLTQKEREMYMLFAGKCMSQYKIADMLYVTRNSVKTTLARAKRKIKANVEKYRAIEEGRIN